MDLNRSGNFREDPEEAENHGGKLRRPLATGILGVLLGFAVPLAYFVKAGPNGWNTLSKQQLVWLYSYSGLVFAMTFAYVFLGTQHSVRFARRIVGTAGLIIILAGLIYFISMLVSVV